MLEELERQVSELEQRKLDSPESESDLEAAVAEALHTVEGIKDKVKGLYLKGRLLAIRGDTREAEKLLTRSIKLDPENVQGWNKLGEMFWENGDVETAKDCFTACLELKQDKAVLRNLSMLVRKLGTTPVDQVKNMNESVRLAKEALAMDYNDAASWYILGNTFLELFFAMSHERKDLESALKAYSQSERLQLAKNPDLYFNRAQVLGFLEEYAAAVDDYKTAKELDPSLPADKQIDTILRKVLNCATLVAKKGHVKPKKLEWLSQSLGVSSTCDRNLSNQESAKAVDTFHQLCEGENKGTRLDVKVVAPLVRGSDPPVSFLVVDRAGNVFGLSVYHLEAGVLTKIKSDRDRITMVDPVLKRVKLGSCEYPLVQLHSPTQFFVNGEPMIDSFAHAAFDSTTQS